MTMIHPALSPIATCNVIWNPITSPKWTQASRHHPKLKKGCDGTRLMWHESGWGKKRYKRRKKVRQNKTIQPPHPLIRAVHHLLISNHLEQNTRLWSALATALLDGIWKTVFVFPVQQVVFVLLVQQDPSYISSRDWALYHLPASKIPFAGREKSAANLVLLWILVRCRNSSQVSFKVRCAGPLPLLRRRLIL